MERARVSVNSRSSWNAPEITMAPPAMRIGFFQRSSSSTAMCTSSALPPAGGRPAGRRVPLGLDWLQQNIHREIDKKTARLSRTRDVKSPSHDLQCRADALNPHYPFGNRAKSFSCAISSGVSEAGIL